MGRNPNVLNIFPFFSFTFQLCYVTHLESLSGMSEHCVWCSSSTECSGCAHKSVRHFCWWNKVSSWDSTFALCFPALFTLFIPLMTLTMLTLPCFPSQNISSPIQDSGNFGSGRNAMLLLKHKILKSILLRRTKKGRAADLALPPRIVCLFLIICKNPYVYILYSVDLPGVLFRLHWDGTH